MRICTPNRFGMFVVTFAIALFGTFAVAHAASITGGDVLKLDVSNSGDGDGGSLADWNQLSTDGTLGAGSVIRHGDGATVDGATITLAGRDGNNDDGNADGWGGEIGQTPGGDPYYIAAANDLIFDSNGSGLTVTFGGLDNALTYNVRLYSLINNDSFPATLSLSVTDGAGTINRTGLNRQTLYDTVPLSSDLIFSGVSTDGSGNIVIMQTSTQPHSFEAVVLEAIAVVPTPAALPAGLAMLGLVAMRRNRK